MNTRKILTFAAGAVAASLAASAQAQTTTSIQFTRGAYGQGTPLTSGQVAGVGVNAVDNWNTARPSGHGLLSGDISDGHQETDTNLSGADVATLVDSTGATSPINYSIVSYGNVNTGSGLSGNDQLLLQSGAATAGTGDAKGPLPVVLTIGGLTIGDSYNFLCYLNSANPAVEGSISLSGGPTYYYLGPNAGAYLSSDPISAYQQATATTDFVAAAGGVGHPSLWAAYQANYALFSGYTATSTTATITMTELGSFGGLGVFAAAGTAGGNEDIGMSGVQIVDLGAIPEPSTWAMMLGGLGMLLTGQRIRRRKS